MIKNKKHIANLITLSRIFGVGFVFWKTPFENNLWQYIVILVFTVICFTDFLDGWVARRFKSVSDLGKVLDPLADKILVLVFLPLLSMHAIAAFPVFIILAREFAIMGLRVVAAKKGYIISANFSGKWKTAFTFPVCGILMGRMPVEMVDVPFYFQPLKWLADWVYSWPSLFFEVLIWVMVGVTIWSFLVYLYEFFVQQNLKKYHGDLQQAKRALLVFIPNSLSLINLLFGLISIFCFFQQSIYVGCAFILTGTILDALDGTVARLLGVHSKLGASLDSKADIVTFGWAPAFLIFCILYRLDVDYIWVLALSLALFYYFCVYFRLKRFSEKGGNKDYFQGVPAPAGAGMVVFAAVLSIFNPLVVFVPVVLLSGFLMISLFSYPHNRIAKQKLFFPQLRLISLVLWSICILMLFGVETLRGFYLPEINLVMMIPYLLSPIWPVCRQ